jgi:hypothetical protein
VKVCAISGKNITTQANKIHLSQNVNVRKFGTANFQICQDVRLHDATTALQKRSDCVREWTCLNTGL